MEFKYHSDELKKKVHDFVNEFGPNLETVERRICKFLHQLQGHNTYRKLKIKSIQKFWNEHKDELLAVEQEFVNKDYSIETINMIEKFATDIGATKNFTCQTICNEIKRHNDKERKKMINAKKKGK